MSGAMRKYMADKGPQPSSITAFCIFNMRRLKGLRPNGFCPDARFGNGASLLLHFTPREFLGFQMEVVATGGDSVWHCPAAYDAWNIRVVRPTDRNLDLLYGECAAAVPPRSSSYL
jgi:hypothetical protein